ncbi:biosynthetic arginine decarboxylase [Spirulina subsalsa FACHB-351]|uniref:Biosynthetic arginine decarboxylase n=1 Tax=Spirulina subsalsa FACHB-351 TaxID=234711 RepID=A0ABT3L6Q3_9CYAN|nr:biosynthetic arginine decarboxylase [Spirulina subsalsa]MCW6037191.1 biosynthetic arginine decarboxylase [Spirulina subsalsa FACHB-351]
MALQTDKPVETTQTLYNPLSSPQTPWRIEDSEALYRIQGWGDPYFSINAAGHVLVSPQGERGGSLDLYELVQELRQRNLNLPLLIRFSDILADRIERLNACFARAIARYNYPGEYRGVYPVKCNQHRHLVESVVKFGKPYQFGLEAGSKPELMIALATLEPALHQNLTSKATLLICNGYKDRDYIETALLSTRLGHTPVIVIEQLSELAIALELSQTLDIAPILGVRAKLSAKGAGHWGESTGDRAKFGLTIPEILQVVTQLKSAGMLDCLQLLHFHIGSQIASISTIKDAIREASQIYVELVKLGANMQYLDVGGGLAVDYDGSKTNFYASKNYNMQNYANDIVAEVQEACEERQVAAPTLVSESGRAIASHQGVLIFDILGASYPALQYPEITSSKENLVIRNLRDTYATITPENYQEAYHDAVQFKEEAISLFNFGYLSLQERAIAEQLYWVCCEKILHITRQQDYVSDDLADLEKNMTAIYYANLSIFQSAPDAWALDQLFPIMPIHRLTEEPTERAILADLTCDSDGKINKFIDLRDIKDSLELHPLQLGPHHTRAPYYLGMFLVGAYQEIMGNLHNLFGDTNVVHIKMTPQGYQVESIVKGDTISEVLHYTQYKPDDLIETVRRRTEQALQEQRITLEEAQRLLSNYEQTLTHYTYLSGAC